MRLEQVDKKCKQKQKINFNSIKVRLELSVPSAKRKRQTNFNSIKVRLELPYSVLDAVPLLFQFHKGAIRTFVSFTLFNEDYISIP